MQKISPLRAGLDAFNKFKASRLKANNTEKIEKTQGNSTNPFGISFKGKILQSDVFQNSSKETTATNPILEGMNNINKFVAGARAAAMNKFESVKQSAISFGNKVKETVTNTYNKLATTEVNFDFLRNSTASLQRRPVTELEGMFKTELENL